MKYEWRKKDKALYLPKNLPTFIDVPTMNYLTLSGEGNPNSEEFAKNIEALYTLSYGLRMLPKKGIRPEGYYEYTVFPLEGYWSLTDEGIALYKEGQTAQELKDYFKYKLMIRQPDFIEKELVEQVRTMVMEKKKNSLLKVVDFESITEGRSIQMLHVGSYDSEVKSFKMMEDYCMEKGYKRISKNHKEIYLSDARKVVPEKLKTTLRFAIE